MLISSIVSLSLIAVGVLANPLEPRQNAQVFTRCTAPNTIALTFDDGPYAYTQEIVNLLDANGAKGTFFFNGNNWDCIYSQRSMSNIKYAYSHGHQVSSHTWAHLDLSTLTWDQIHDEMWRVELALLRIVGAYPAFMRPPYGSYNDLVLQASAIRGQGVVIWDFDSLDSDGASTATSKSLYDQILGQHPNTLLALNHETLVGTVRDVLPYVVPRLKAAGYNLVTVAECLGLQPYQYTQAPGTPDGSWTC